MPRVLKNHALMCCLLVFGYQWLSAVEKLGSFGFEDEVYCAQVAFAFCLECFLLDSETCQIEELGAYLSHNSQGGPRQHRYIWLSWEAQRMVSCFEIHAAGDFSPVPAFSSCLKQRTDLEAPELRLLRFYSPSNHENRVIFCSLRTSDTLYPNFPFDSVIFKLFILAGLLHVCRLSHACPPPAQ